MKNARMTTQARRELDRRLLSVDLRALGARPHRGWIRAVRSALGMSQAALAARLAMTQSAVAQQEQAELVGGITIAKLTEVAAALDCTLVYALVPNTTLEDTVARQAREVADRELGYVDSTMALEDQAVTQDRQAGTLEATMRDIVASGRLWDVSPRVGTRRRTSR